MKTQTTSSPTEPTSTVDFVSLIRKLQNDQETKSKKGRAEIFTEKPSNQENVSENTESDDDKDTPKKGSVYVYKILE